MRIRSRPAAILLVAFLAVLIGGPGESSTTTGNLLSNPGFERKDSGWSVRGGTLEMTRLARSGAFAAVLTRQGKRGYITLDDSENQVVPTAGTRCAASGWVRARPGSEVRIRLREFAGEKVVAARGATIELPDAVWHRVSTWIELAGSRHELDLNIYGVGFPPEGILLVDDVVEACASLRSGEEAIPASTPGAGPASQATNSPSSPSSPSPEAAASPSSEATPTPEPAPSPTPSTDSTTGPSASPSPSANPQPQPASVGETVTIAAAGDIACDPNDGAFNGGAGTGSRCRQRATSDLVLQLAPDAVLPLGDTQYEVGALSAYRQSYDPTWGRFKSISHPIAGNHEYETPGASGYFSYFGSAAGDRSKGYYSYDVGSWHVVALNTQCDEIGGCGVGSPQERWLRQDLQDHRSECTLVQGHKPRFSSGLHGNLPDIDALWRAMYDNGVDVILSGNDHNYERFAPQDPSGRSDAARGLRQFVVGTGGKSLRAFGRTQPNSERRIAQTFGVLRLSLHPGSYAWQFVTLPNASIQDSGTTACN
jgi:calcineurin-like phosphoesterase family protein